MARRARTLTADGERPLTSDPAHEATSDRARHLILLAPVGIYFFSYFHRIAPAVVVADLMAAFSPSAAMLGLLSAVYPWIFATMALPAGTLADTAGPRWTLTAGASFMALGAIVFGIAPTFGVAVAGRVLVGLGASVILIAWLRLGAAWARPEETARLAGLTQTVGAIGGLVGTAPLALLVTRLGWRASFVAIGAVTGLVGAVCAVIVRDRPRPTGLARTAPPAAGGFADVVRAARAVVANPASWPPVLTSAGIYATFLTFVGLWGVPYLVQVYGLSRVAASSYTAWGAAGILIGAISIGWLSDRLLVRRRLPLIVFAALYAAVWYPLAIPEGPRLPLPCFVPLCFLLGLTSSVVAVVFAVVPEVNDPRRPGVAIGFCNIPSFTGIAILQWLTGVMLDAGFAGEVVDGVRVYPFAAYRAVFMLCAALATGAAISAFGVTETRCRNVWRGAGSDARR